MGHVNGHGTGIAKWLIVPTTDCAANGPTEYYVGGTLSYVEDGLEVRRSLTAVPIVVYPQPELKLDYFMQRDVYADDPWTDEIEPSQPFELAVMVTNYGAGEATNLTIESSQPVIVENERGMLIDFEIIGTEVAGETITPTLTAEFGQLDPGEIKVAQWWMTSTLQGHFIDYDVSFRHIDGLGNERLSLIKDVAIHELIHTVNAGGDQDPTVDMPDFLVNDVPDGHDDPDTLYLSDGSVENVSLVTAGTFDGGVSLSDLTVNLTVDLAAGWNYIRLEDPSQFEYELAGVNSGAATLKSENFWQTDRTFIGGGLRPLMEDNVHLLVFADESGSYSYNLEFESRDQTAPSLQGASLPADVTDEDVDEIILEFDEPVDLSDADLSLLRDQEEATPDPATAGKSSAAKTNSVIPLTKQGLGLERIDDTHYRVVGLSSLTGQAGDYRLLLDLSNVQDASGNYSDETTEFTWTRVDEAPIVKSIEGLDTALRNTPVGDLTVTFSKAISSGSFTTGDISLTRDGGPNLIDAAVSLTNVDGFRFTIEGLDRLTTADGDYVLTIHTEGVVGHRRVDWIRAVFHHLDYRHGGTDSDPGR